MQSLAAEILKAEPRFRQRGSGLLKVAAPFPRNGRSQLKIYFDRAHLIALRKALREWRETWSDDDPAFALGQALHSSCFPRLERLINSPPRGRTGIQERVVTRYIAPALHAARFLVTISSNEPGIRRRIDAITQNDIEIAAYRAAATELGWNADQAEVISLADRALRGAWEKAVLPGLIFSASRNVRSMAKIQNTKAKLATRYRDPRDVFREYLYHDRAFSQSLHNLYERKPHLIAHYRTWAESILLGQPGDAARHYHLI